MAYFYGQPAASLYTSCRTSQNIIDNGGKVIENLDGTVSVFIGYDGELIPYDLNEVCCKKLNEGYFFDTNSQKCKHSEIASNPSSCLTNTPLNLIINPKGNDGSLFFVNKNQNCSLDINFSYLFKIKCQDLLKSLTPDNSTVTAENFLTKEINKVKLEIQELEVKKESITNDIVKLDSDLKKTPYSIECDSYPIEYLNNNFSNVVVYERTPPTLATRNYQEYYKNYTKTGFGSQKWNSPIYWTGYMDEFNYGTEVEPPKTKKVNFCITEPNGLFVWGTILGNRYQSFLNGDPDSYTCEDVITFTYPYVANRFSECTTPFGSKNIISNKISIKANEIIEIDKQIDEKEIELINLENSLTTEVQTCKTPLEVLETLNVSMSLDVVESTNKTKSVYSKNLVNMT